MDVSSEIAVRFIIGFSLFLIAMYISGMICLYFTAMNLDIALQFFNNSAVCVLFVEVK